MDESNKSFLFHSIYKILYVFIFLSSIQANLNNNTQIKLELTNFNKVDYIKLTDLTSTHNFYTKFYETKDKLEISINHNKIYISPSSPYCKINDNIYNLTYPVIHKNKSIYIPVLKFYKSLEAAKLPLRIIKKESKHIIVSPNIYNIIEISSISKQNGTLVTLKTNKQFFKEQISSSISSSKWLNITILNGIVDSLTFNEAPLNGKIKKIQTIQAKESAQISILFSNVIEDIDMDIKSNEINFLLRDAMEENAQKINEIKQKWLIDTIVIDPGHGGKDPGAIGYKNLNEKEITLAIALKLGKLLESNLGLNVVYTRKKDIFIPLWERTKMANEAEGKLFISIHANSAPNSPHTKGFETYLLRPGKTGQAIAVATRENAVIELEATQNNYKDINEHFIIAAMAQNSFMKESEDFAALIQKNMNNNLKTASRDRGVKQAGFHVLVGASMPNVLVEIGFLSNKNEAQNLSKSYYQQKIADAIYKAILDFKIKYEKPLTQK